MSQFAFPELAGFADLPKVEQIRWLQALWDRITDAPDDLPPLESHLDLACERLADHQHTPSVAGSAYEVLDRLAKKVP